MSEINSILSDVTTWLGQNLGLIIQATAAGVGGLVLSGGTMTSVLAHGSRTELSKPGIFWTKISLFNTDSKFEIADSVI